MKKPSLRAQILSTFTALGILLGAASVSAASLEAQTTTNMESNSDITVPADSLAHRCPPNC